MNKHAAVRVIGDDLICVPGAYEYLSAALNHCWNKPFVMSVSGWTHPRIKPSNVNDHPNFGLFGNRIVLSEETELRDKIFFADL